MPCLVRIVNQVHLLCVTAQKCGVLLGQAGAKRRHGAVKAVLVQGNGIHIPLHQNQVAQLAFLCQIQGEEVLPFIKDDGFGGIEILGSGVVHHTAAKANHIPPDIDNGKHQPVAEAVVDSAALFRHQACILQLLLRIALGLHGIHQAVPAVGSKADSEFGKNGRGHAPLLGIGQAFRPGGAVELAVEIPGRFLGKGPQPLLLAVPALVLLVLRDLHPCPLCQGPHRIRVTQPLNFHHEIDHAAALVAAEAVVNSLIRGYGKGSSFLSVEGAQAKEVCTGAFQVHILPHHFLDGVSCHQFIHK